MLLETFEIHTFLVQHQNPRHSVLVNVDNPQHTLWTDSIGNSLVLWVDLWFNLYVKTKLISLYLPWAYNVFIQIQINITTISISIY